MTRWQLWWEFNQDRYLRRRPGEAGDDGKARGTPVSAETRRDVILPALAKAMARTNNRDLTTACMVAMAKIGVDHADIQILPVLLQRLQRGDQEVRETAALALGISERPEAVAPLIDLLLDRTAGQRLVRRAHVDDRTRAFAAHALGLVAHGNDDPALKDQIRTALAGVLDDKTQDDREILVGALNGFRLLHLTPRTRSRHKRLLWQSTRTLAAFEERDMGKGDQLVQAHAPTAVARLLGRGDSDEHRAAKERYSALLDGDGRKNNDIYRSAAIALGRLALPAEELADDATYSATLHAAARSHRDVQVRYFSLIALGQIGGEANLKRLLAVFADSKGATKAWAALALGVLCHACPDQPGTRQQGPRDIAGRALLRGLDDAKNRDVRAAIAVALGLADHDPAAPVLRDMLKRYYKVEEYAGYLCIGLALMDDRSAIRLIDTTLAEAGRRPFLMAQAALALSRLQERNATATLHEMIRRGDHSNLKLIAAARALGFIGDAGSVEPLLRLLGDSSAPKMTRAFAAVALGVIADDDRLPWNAKIAENLNYRAMVESLSNGASGVLDIL